MSANFFQRHFWFVVWIVLERLIVLSCLLAVRLGCIARIDCFSRSVCGIRRVFAAGNSPGLGHRSNQSLIHPIQSNRMNRPVSMAASGWQRALPALALRSPLLRPGSCLNRAAGSVRCLFCLHLDRQRATSPRKDRQKPFLHWIPEVLPSESASGSMLARWREPDRVRLWQLLFSDSIAPSFFL